jgi:hypothetical protein
LVYAHDASSQHHIVSANLLTAAISGQFQAVLAEKNLLKLYRILTNPVAMKNKPMSAIQAKRLSCSPLFYLLGEGVGEGGTL